MSCGGKSQYAFLTIGEQSYGVFDWSVDCTHQWEKSSDQSGSNFTFKRQLLSLRMLRSLSQYVCFKFIHRSPCFELKVPSGDRHPPPPIENSLKRPCYWFVAGLQRLFVAGKEWGNPMESLLSLGSHGSCVWLHRQQVLFVWRSLFGILHRAWWYPSSASSYFCLRSSLHWDLIVFGTYLEFQTQDCVDGFMVQSSSVCLFILRPFYQVSFFLTGGEQIHIAKLS